MQTTTRAEEPQSELERYAAVLATMSREELIQLVLRLEIKASALNEAIGEMHYELDWRRGRR